MAISSTQRWPSALGYQQERERKDYGLQRAVSGVSAAATLTDRGWWALSFPAHACCASMVRPHALGSVMRFTGWKSYPEPINPPPPPVLSRIIRFVEKFLEGISMKIPVNLRFKAVRILKYVFVL